MARPQDHKTEDIVWGAEAIAEVIGVPRTKAYNMLENGHLPARKVGRRWVASRSKLLAFLLEEVA